MDCYIYYKSKEEHTEQILAGVRQVKNLLTSDMHSPVQLQRRPMAQDGLITWMEIYRDVPDDFDTRINAVLNDSDLKLWIVGDRHQEYFLPQI